MKKVLVYLTIIHMVTSMLYLVNIADTGQSLFFFSHFSFTLPQLYQKQTNII
jgi:hypothetical protein